jgi:hypothetical protein
VAGLAIRFLVTYFTVREIVVANAIVAVGLGNALEFVLAIATRGANVSYLAALAARVVATQISLDLGASARAFADLSRRLEITQDAGLTTARNTVDRIVVDLVVAVVVDAIAKLVVVLVFGCVLVIAVRAQALRALPVNVTVTVNAADAVVGNTLHAKYGVGARDQSAGETGWADARVLLTAL